MMKIFSKEQSAFAYFLAFVLYLVLLSMLTSCSTSCYTGFCNTYSQVEQTDTLNATN